MKRGVFTSCIFLFFFLVNIQFTHAQGCFNADFSDSSFVNWTGRTGTCCPLNMTANGIVSGRHTIMSLADPPDPNTCDSLSVVPPGFMYSARLGNDSAGTQAERLSYTYQVTPSSALFQFDYAVVLQEPGHAPADAPRFMMRVLNQNGQLLYQNHYFEVIADGSPRFKNCGSVRYTNWETVSIYLADYIGQNITVEFSTGDCDLGGHFGYAYVVAECDSAPHALALETEYVCTSDNDSVLLTAPQGFNYQWSTGDTTRTIMVVNPPFNSIYSCTLTDLLGVNVLQTTITSIPVANFGYDSTQTLTVNFTDSSLGNITNWQWDFGDGQSSSIQNPTHTYDTAGTYDVSLTITSSQGCKSSYDTIVVLTLPPDTTQDTTQVDGIDELQMFGFEVYPVPSSDEITVSLHSNIPIEKLSLNIYDVIGNLVFAKSLENLPKKHSFNLSLDDFATGVYTIELKTKDTSLSRKFIKN